MAISTCGPYHFVGENPPAVLEITKTHPTLVLGRASIIIITTTNNNLNNNLMRSDTDG